MIVYRPDGVAEEKENCDARECVQHCGYSFTPPDGTKQVEAPKVVQVETPKIDEVTVAPMSQVSEEYVPKRGRPSKFNSEEI